MIWRKFNWNEQKTATVMRGRGVFVRAYGWYAQWFTEPTEYHPSLGYYAPYEAENLLGFLAVKNEGGTYDCLPIGRHETRHRYPKEGPVWVRNFLPWDWTDSIPGTAKHVLGHGIDYITSVDGAAGHSIEWVVELPNFQSAQQLREYLHACGTRRTSEVIDPIGEPVESDTPAYRDWWYMNEQAWLKMPGAIPGARFV